MNGKTLPEIMGRKLSKKALKECGNRSVSKLKALREYAIQLLEKNRKYLTPALRSKTDEQMYSLYAEQLMHCDEAYIRSQIK